MGLFSRFRRKSLVRHPNIQETAVFEDDELPTIGISEVREMVDRGDLTPDSDADEHQPPEGIIARARFYADRNVFPQGASAEVVAGATRSAEALFGKGQPENTYSVIGERGHRTDDTAIDIKPGLLGVEIEEDVFEDEDQIVFSLRLDEAEALLARAPGTYDPPSYWKKYGELMAKRVDALTKIDEALGNSRVPAVVIPQRIYETLIEDLEDLRRNMDLNPEGRDLTAPVPLDRFVLWVSQLKANIEAHKEFVDTDD